MKTLSKILATFLTCTTLALNFAPVLALENTVAAPDAITTSSALKFEDLPAFPEDANRPAVDYASMDWDEQIILPRDLQNYREQIDNLISQGKEKEVANVRLKKTTRGDDEALSFYNVPKEVTEAVKDYKAQVRKKPGDKIRLADTLKARLSPQAVQGSVPVVQNTNKSDKTIESLIDVRTAPKLQIKNVINSVVGPVAPVKLLNRRSFRASKKSLQAVTVEGLKVKMQVIKKPLKKTSFLNTIKNTTKTATLAVTSLFSVDTVSAVEPTPLMAYYSGIEKNTMDSVLYYLSQHQNTDSSFGEFNNYELTANVALQLSRFNRTSNDQYAGAVNYLTTTVPQNNREKAIKARVLAGLGTPSQALLNELLAAQDPVTGGIGLDSDYQPDAQTTLEVALAFSANNYSVDNALPKALAFTLAQIRSDGSMYYTDGSNPSYFLINKTVQNLKPFESLSLSDGQNNVPVRQKIDLLLQFLRDHYSADTGAMLGSSDVVDSLMTLRSFQLYNTDLDKQAVLLATAKERQKGDGSFGTSLYATESAMEVFPQPDLQITAMQPVGTLQGRQQANFTLTVRNNGYASSGEAYIYTFVDNTLMGKSVNLSAAGINIAPGEEVNIVYTADDGSHIVGSTRFSFYIEGKDEITFDNNWSDASYNVLAPANNNPALPPYFMVTQYSSNGNTGINMRWLYKEDPNRLAYAIIFRETGTQAWQYLAADNTSNGVWLVGFPENSYYDFTVGVILKDGTTVIGSTSDVTKVHVSSDNNAFTGTANGFVTANNEAVSDVDVQNYGGIVKTDGSGNFVYQNSNNGSNVAYVVADQYEKMMTKYYVPEGQTISGVRLFTRLKDDAVAPVATLFRFYQAPANNITKNQRTLSFVFNATDNVALKEADFYYFEPSTLEWKYLETVSFQGRQQIIYDWYMPSELVGAGYKLKAMAWDYKDNHSDYLESPTFEIIDGSAPSGSITVQGLENNVWPLGAAKTISWNIQAKNPLSKINPVLLYRNGGSVPVLWNLTVNDTSKIYTMPVEAQYINSDVYVEITACDVNENCSTFASDHFEIADKTPPIANSIVSYPIQNSHRLKNQASVLVSLSAYDNIALKEANYEYWNAAQSVWVHIATVPYLNYRFDLNWYIPAGLTGTGFKVRAVAVDQAGNISAPIETSEFEIVDGTAPIGDVSISSLGNNEWSLGDTKTIVWNVQTANPLDKIQSVQLHRGNTVSDIPFTAQTIQGSLQYTIPLNADFVTNDAFVTVTACDTNQNCATISSGHFAVVENTPPPAPPWGTPAVFQSFTPTYDVSRELVDVHDYGNGSLGIVYTENEGDVYVYPGQYRRIVYRKFANGAWQAPVVLTQEVYRRNVSAQDMSFVNIRALWKDTGDVHVAYQRFVYMDDYAAGVDAVEVYYAHAHTNGSVSNHQVSNDSTYSTDPVIEVNDSGTVFISWVEGFSNTTKTGVNTIHFVEGDGIDTWSTPVELVPGETTSNPSIVLENNEPVILFVYSYDEQYNLLKKHNGVWSSRVVVTKPDIEKRRLDVFTEDADKLQFIVTANPDNSGEYLFLSSIHTKTDLKAVLDAHAFARKNDILDTWKQNEYSENSYNKQFFSAGNGVYDIFRRQDGFGYDGKFTLKRLRFSVDWSGGYSMIIKSETLADISGTEIVNALSVVPAGNDSYHVAYIIRGADDNSSMNRPYYFLLTPQGKYFHSRVGPLLLSATDNYIDSTVFGSTVSVYFRGYMSNVYTTILNRADFSGISNYRIDNTSPFSTNATKVPLTWDISGGLVDGVSLLFGQNKYYMEQMVTGITSSNYTVENLAPSTTYYWQIVAHNNGKNIYSNVWRAQTPALRLPGAVENLSATAGDGSAHLNWSAPSDTGGSAITGYFVKFRKVGSQSYVIYRDGEALNMNSTATGLENDVQYEFVVAAKNILGNGELTSIFVTPSVPPLVLSDAEDGETAGWFVSTDGVPSTITNVNEGGAHGKVISLNGSGWGSVFLFKNPDSTLLDHAGYPVLSFDTNMESNYVTVNVDTDNSERNLTYMVYPTGALNKPYYSFDGRMGVPDGTWRTVTHDLQKDLSSVEPNTKILKVNSIAIRGSGKIDNVKLLVSAPVYTLSGKITDDSGAPLAGVTVSLQPLGRGAVTNADGIYRFVSLPTGSYNLTLTKATYSFPVSNYVDVADSNVDFPIQAGSINSIMYSDAEDGSTPGWFVSTDGAPSTITNVNEGGVYGKVVSLNGSGWSSVFILKKPDNTWWNQKGYPVIEFDTNMETDIVYVKIDTSVGDKTMVYMPSTVSTPGTGFSLQFDGRTGIPDGTWRHISRDLQADLAVAIPGAKLVSVGGLFVRGFGKIDNVQLRTTATMHTISGRVLDNTGSPLSGALVTLSPSNLSVTTGADGVYRFTSLSGAYTLSAQKDKYNFVPSSLVVTVDADKIDQNFVGTQITSLMIDNAEDGDTAGWFVSTDSVATSSIANVQTTDSRGRVISLMGQGWNSVYLLKKPDNTWWGAKNFKSIRYDVNSGGVIVTVKINTNKGDRQITYYPGVVTNHGNGPYYRFDGSTSESDGVWRSVVRNLQADLNSVEPETTLMSIDGLIIRGTAQFDNVELVD